VFFLLAALLAEPAVNVDALRMHALRVINQDRAEAMLAPLVLDGEASRIADARAQDVLDGASLEVPVYVWYSQAGGNDSVNENLHAWTVSYDFTEPALRELIRRSQLAIMSDQPPHHGRRETILDPLATHAAIGFAWDGDEFQLVQLILRKYVHFALPLPRCAKTTDLVHVAGWPLGDVVFDAISVHYEPPPNTTRRAKKKRNTVFISGHALPQRRREYLPKLKSGYEYRARGTGDVRTGKAGEFALDIPFTDGPGVYTVVIWTKFPGAEGAFAATMTSIVVE
jgi:hypothetical protein